MPRASASFRPSSVSISILKVSGDSMPPLTLKVDAQKSGASVKAACLNSKVSPHFLSVSPDVRSFDASRFHEGSEDCGGPAEEATGKASKMEVTIRRAKRVMQSSWKRYVDISFHVNKLAAHYFGEGSM